VRCVLWLLVTHETHTHVLWLLVTQETHCVLFFLFFVEREREREREMSVTYGRARAHSAPGGSSLRDMRVPLDPLFPYTTSFPHTVY